MSCKIICNHFIISNTVNIVTPVTFLSNFDLQIFQKPWPDFRSKASWRSLENDIVSVACSSFMLFLYRSLSWRFLLWIGPYLGLSASLQILQELTAFSFNASRGLSAIDEQLKSASQEIWSRKQTKQNDLTRYREQKKTTFIYMLYLYIDTFGQQLSINAYCLLVLIWLIPIV